MKFGAATPTTDEMKPIEIVVGVTPGALALLPTGAFEVFEEPPDFFDELPHAAPTTTMTATTATALTNRRRTVPPSYLLP